MFSFGKPHSTLQQFDCSAEDLESLLNLLSDRENPFTNWRSTKTTPSPSDITTWFPRDAQHPVFHSFSSADSNGQRQSRPLTYSDLHECITLCPPYFPAADGGRAVTVGLLLPNTMMAEMAVVMVSLMAKNVCVAPLDPNMPTAKLFEAFKQLECNGIVTTKDFLNLDFVNESNFDDIRVVEAKGEKVGTVQWTVRHQKPGEVESPPDDAKPKWQDTASGKDQPKLLLRTSGTTSVPKVVPLTASSLLYNAICISASLQLQQGDVGCNAMPLFHIGGVSCALLSVLVSGSSVVMMGSFDPEAFLDCLTTEHKASDTAIPTWYYGVPSMHRTLTLTARARMQEGGMEYIPTNLRFIRSGAAHLPHDDAVKLSEVFRTLVYPTYSMSETMPICSSHENPVIWNDVEQENKTLPNSVGHPIGCSLRIVNELGNALPYRSPGEVALFGAGVMKGYVGIDRTDSHTPDGWLRTGDIGEMDANGNIKLVGRLKEMIKVGGEQVWPNEVDRVVEMVPGVSTAVTFGVPNDLWGEEVAVAVVTDEEKQTTASGDQVTLERMILEKCRVQLDHAAVPSQIIFVPTTADLLKGPTGKFLRTPLASHLKVEPVNTGALRILEARATQTIDKDKDPTPPTKQEVLPSSALNGVRFLTACFVVQGHIGLYPNNAWIRIASFSLNMQIFFVLGAFQLACSVKNSVLKNWADWVGTKIGTMHSLFVLTQLIALPSYLLFMCGSNGYMEVFEEQTCQESGFLKSFLPQFVIHTATAMVPRLESVNPPAWFQMAFYMFLMIFPPLDAHLRKIPGRGLAWRLALNLAIATFFYVFVHLWLLQFLMIGWLPTLVSSMIAGYFFTRHAVTDKNSIAPTFFQNPRFQGILTDTISVVFLILEILVALSPDCIYMREKEFVEMRPGEDIPEDSFVFDETTYVYACDVTNEEYVDYVFEQSRNVNYGRWETAIAGIFGWYRVGTPFVLLWLYAMSHGRGLTARIFNMKLFQWLAPLAYPLYLLHVPMSRYYWIATRGLEAEYWWPEASMLPVPVEWYETFIIIGISLIVGYILDRCFVSFLSRYTVWIGVKICRVVSRCFSFCCCCCCKATTTSQTQSSSSSSSRNNRSNLEKVQDMVQRITGMDTDQITRSTNLKDLGLDSLGTTALMGTLRVSIPSARKLTLPELTGMETIGDLVDALDAFDDAAAAAFSSSSSSRSSNSKGSTSTNDDDVDVEEKIGSFAA